MAASDFNQFIEQYHHALDEIWKGNPEGYYRLYSRGDDVTGFERIATGITPEFAYIVEMERGRTKVGGADETSSIALRVTSIFDPKTGPGKSSTVMQTRLRPPGPLSP